MTGSERWSSENCVDKWLYEQTRIYHFQQMINHERVGKVIHWELYKGLKFGLTSKWYMNQPEYVPENESHKIPWDFGIQMDHLILVKKNNT